MPATDDPAVLLETTRVRARARFADHVIADTDDAILLREAGYAPVLYFPIDDVEMAYLGATDHATHCPLKGTARYWTIVMDGQVAENAVWAYDDPLPDVAALRGRVAFYPDKVEVYVVEDDDDALGVGREVTPAHPPQ